MADEFDRPLGGALDGVLVDRADGGAAVGLAHHPRMRHAGKPHVVDEDGAPENLVRQIEARAACADVLKIRNRLALPAAGRLDGEVHRGRERPVILAGRCAMAQDAAVADRKLAGLAADDPGGLLEKQRAHVGAGLPQRDAAELDRLAAGGVALVRCQRGIARADGDALHRHVEFVGGDLRHGGEHALADLDAAGADGNLAGRGERDPAIEARIVVERAGQRGVHEVFQLAHDLSENRFPLFGIMRLLPRASARPPWPPRG